MKYMLLVKHYTPCYINSFYDKVKSRTFEKFIKDIDKKKPLIWIQQLLVSAVAANQWKLNMFDGRNITNKCGVKLCD